MTAKIFCALSSDINLTGFHVDFDVSLTVSDLKDAIRAKKDIPGSVELTLVRIWKADVGGLTKRELKQSREFLSLTAYGNDPEDGDDVVSVLQTFPGACQAKDGLTFKVMNSMEQVSVFTASLPAKLFHVLVLIPSKEKVVMDLALREAREYHTAMAGTGPMDVDGSSTSGSESVDDIIVEEALKQLSSLVLLDGDSDKRNIFTAQESMETFIQPANVLSLEIHGFNGIPDLLYSSEIYDDEKSLGIKMPVDDLLKITTSAVVLIGVSGCGKTRTCFDYARHRWCLYFDCTKDVDLFAMVDVLAARKPLIKTEASQQAFEVFSTKLIKSLIGARMLVLRVLLERNPNYNQFDWHCNQRSHRTRNLFEKIFSRLSSYSAVIVAKIFGALKGEFNGRVIFDESQHLLTILNLDYRSSKPDQRGISNNRLDFPRSFFSFVAGCVLKTGMKSIWCGTHMRIRNMDLMYSAAGDKPEEVYIFTRFTYLTPGMIFKLCSKWIQPAVFQENRSTFEEASNFLQGRPRFFISFLHKLVQSDNVQESLSLYRTEMTTERGSSFEEKSPFYFWKKQFSEIVEPISGASDGKKLVSEILLQLCISSLFGNGSTISFHEDLDLVSTSLVMVNHQFQSWGACMAEPIVLSAGLNFLASKSADALMDHFATKVFAPFGPLNLSPQERGHVMELIIALRFMQGWWQEPELKAFLPEWVNGMNIPKPVGILDCRSEPNGNMFLQQLQNAAFPYVLLPAVNAGPDLQYSVFTCYDKTTYTCNSESSMYISVEEAQENLATMKPANWYKSQAVLHTKCSEELKYHRFVHMCFELPDTAPSMTAGFKSGAVGNDFVICVNLTSDFALKFFGNKFVTSYRKFVKRPSTLIL